MADPLPPAGRSPNGQQEPAPIPRSTAEPDWPPPTGQPVYQSERSQPTPAYGPAWPPRASGPPPSQPPPPGYGAWGAPRPGGWGPGYPALPEQPKVQPPLQGEPRKLLRIELAVVAFLFAVPGLAFGLGGVTDPQGVDTTELTVSKLLAAVFGSLGPAVLVCWILWRDGHLRAAGLRAMRALPLIGYAALAFVGAVAAVIAAGVVLSAIDPGGDGGGSPEINTSALSVTAAMLLSLCAGIAEEITWRAYGVTRMEQAGWPRAAIVVPWALWTAQHLYAGAGALVVVGAAGLVWLAIFRWKRNIWPLVIAHALYDVTVFLIVLSQP